MHRIASVFAAGLLLASHSAARANDSTAELGLGGLVLVPNDDIQMAEEDLSISPSEVRVRYVYANKADHDVTLLVAFPLPTLEGSPDFTTAVPTDDAVNYVAFKTLVEGRPVETQVQQRVTAVGVDQTDYLKGLGVPLAPQLEATRKAIEALPAEKRAELVNLGLTIEDEYDDGSGMKKHPTPMWKLDTVFFWQQRFPAKGTLHVEHSYKPSIGATAGISFGTEYSDKETTDDYRKRYCMDRSFEDAVAKLRTKANEGDDWAYENRIDYVLTTGANWAGPIGAFKLTVDKGDPAALVSFCGEGVKKVAPTRFEMTRTDFEPKDDIHILIVKKSEDR